MSNFMANFSKETQKGMWRNLRSLRAGQYLFPGSFDETYHAAMLSSSRTISLPAAPRLFVTAGATFDHNYAQSLTCFSRMAAAWVMSFTERTAANSTCAPASGTQTAI